MKTTKLSLTSLEKELLIDAIDLRLQQFASIIHDASVGGYDWTEALYREKYNSLFRVKKLL